MEPKYKRIMIKLSGEAMSGDNGFGLEHSTINAIAKQIKRCYDMGVEIGIVIGGGNFWRGRDGEGMDRSRADHMGMLATVINCLAMLDALEQVGVEARVQTAIEMRQIAEPYIRLRAGRHLEKGRVVIFACGIGNPYFTTDSAAALRAVEMNAEVILLAKNVDGVYDKDPKKYADAKKYDRITYMQSISERLGVMDTTALTLCMENNLPIFVFALNEENSIKRAASGEKIGTIVEGE